MSDEASEVAAGAPNVARAEQIHPDDRILVTAETRFRDYILTAYEPRCDPQGKLHGASLLKGLLRHHDMQDAWAVCETLRAHLGSDETVWGFKLGPAAPSVELYFYNFEGADVVGHDRSVTTLGEVLAPHLHFSAPMAEAQSYFMCSFELSPRSLASGDAGCFRIYVGSGDESRRECAFWYRVERGRLPLENHYWFYRASDSGELADAVRRLKRSPRSGAKPCWGKLMPAHLRSCFTICYAVKPQADGLYFSRIGTEQLVPFLEAHRPGPLLALLRHHEDDFAHQRWDLGFDFATDSPASDAVSIDKIAIHGVL